MNANLITDVGIDLDGVLYNFAHEFREYCTARLGVTELPYPKHWEFYEDWGLDKDTFYQWLNEATEQEQIFNRGLPYPLVLEGWEKLRTLDVKIHILTHRHPLAYAQTAEWLLRYGLVPDTLHFGANKNILKTLSTGTAAAIDDYTGYYDSYTNANIKAFMMSQPWNAQHPGRRVPDMLAFAHAIEVHNEYHRMEMVLKKNPLKPFTTTSNPNLYTKPKHPDNNHFNPYEVMKTHYYTQDRTWKW